MHVCSYWMKIQIGCSRRLSLLALCVGRWPRWVGLGVWKKVRVTLIDCLWFEIVLFVVVIISVQLCLYPPHFLGHWNPSYVSPPTFFAQGIKWSVCTKIAWPWRPSIWASCTCTHDESIEIAEPACGVCALVSSSLLLPCVHAQG